MPIRAGTLDRKITIQRKTSTSLPDGTPVDGWTTLATNKRSASMKPFRAAEGFMIPAKTAYEQVEFHIRYSQDLLDLSPLDRIIYPALSDADASNPSFEPPEREIYDILGVLEIERREGFRIITSRRPDLTE